MLEKLARKYIEEAKFGKKESALFYLGVMARAIDKKEEGWDGTQKAYGDKVYTKAHFEKNIEVLYSQTVLKLAEHELEEGLAWAMKGFVDNYTDEVEQLEADEKRFYILSGTAFYGTLGACVDADEWISASEATEKWGLGASTIRQAIHEKRLLPGEYRKSGSVWLVRKSAMKRMYGEPKGKLDINAIEAILEIQNLSIDFESFATGDELANWLDGRRFPEFDEPFEISEYQREALREIYGA